jgi:hypothetical protein
MPVGVEKVAFLERLPKFGDRKCPGDPERIVYIAHPDAILFSRFSREGVFQQATPVFNNCFRLARQNETARAADATACVRSAVVVLLVR